MFRAHHLRPNLPWSRPKLAGFTISSTSSNHPNAPLDLDPSLRALLKDVDISITNHNSQHRHRELEVLSAGLSMAGEANVPHETPDEEDSLQRKSPAARFGSERIGAVVLPFELQKSIGVLISESDKHQLRSDAKRLFLEAGGLSEPQWKTKYDVKYRTRRQAVHHFERDGTAFASIALPAHYSAISAVLEHVKKRLEPDWRVEKVIEWGVGAGSGLWASLYSFQQTSESQHEIADNELKISHSTVMTYLGLDKRDHLVSIGKQLLRDVNLGSLNLRWQKSFQEDDKITRSDGQNALALSAFMLSSLPTPLAKKALVKEMWESGAHIMVLIDHNTTAGFESIAGAREYLLNAGRKESADSTAGNWAIRGSHIVAPCPHDGACPLYHPGSSRLLCNFSQRLQRPSFVRLTKHSGVGHEDIGYSYVVVRRGPRPSASDVKVGRIGEVGKWALAKQAALQIPMKELKLHGDRDEARSLGMESLLTTAPSESIHPEASINEPKSRAELQDALRSEAFNWPRLVFPPLKKSGHIIIDCCTAEGKIMRMTIPKSQGKQAYYDARKSSWGDIFPHEPKNAPQERHQPVRAKRDGGTTPTRGEDIGKRRASSKPMQRIDYALSEDLKVNRGQKRGDRFRFREAEFD